MTPQEKRANVIAKAAARLSTPEDRVTFFGHTRHPKAGQPITADEIKASLIREAERHHHRAKIVAHPSVERDLHLRANELRRAIAWIEHETRVRAYWASRPPQPCQLCGKPDQGCRMCSDSEQEV